MFNTFLYNFFRLQRIPITLIRGESYTGACVMSIIGPISSQVGSLLSSQWPAQSVLPLTLTLSQIILLLLSISLTTHVSQLDTHAMRRPFARVVGTRFKSFSVDKSFCVSRGVWPRSRTNIYSSLPPEGSAVPQCAGRLPAALFEHRISFQYCTDQISYSIFSWSKQ